MDDELIRKTYMKGVKYYMTKQYSSKYEHFIPNGCIFMSSC
ncbi:hypothetical protein SAMN06265348_109131 [Pedobacter westerhofensis]|uniref:Uncharacterized protein n=1 Tax=Pedobacter westerhofensis TaxID=425512 RepID=A0A521EU85_9SPHI|nr:hypothetical protein SAMN06265348_109131 [Pedobacter westerhofensis]